MYGAWSVVVSVIPKLPEAPLSRAWWLLQLAQGAGDARSHPEQYAALVGLLWNALEHSCTVARAAAATALAQHPLDTVHELAELRPLCNVIQVAVRFFEFHSLLCFTWRARWSCYVT
jgi:hypothetical protein